MVEIDVGFQPRPYEKALIQQTREEIQSRLQGHEFGRLKIVLKKHPRSQKIALQFLGNPESCDLARRLLSAH